MAEKDSMLSIPKFDGDYEHWAMLMENLLRSKEWWNLIEDGITEYPRGTVLNGQQRTELAEQKLKDLKVKNYLFASIEKTILKQILQKNTSKELWDSMKVKYQGNERVQSAQLQRLRRNFEILEMKSGESVSDYFSRVMLIANDMRNLGEILSDGKIVEKILRTLSENFTYIVCAIEESKDIKNLSVDELQSSLLVHEQKFKRTVDDEQVLKISDEVQKNGYRGRGAGRGSFRGRGRSQGRGYSNRATIECYKCHKLGHYQYDCPEWVNYAELEEEEEMVLMAHIESHAAKCDHVWFLDSGCSNHMTGDKQWFSDLDEQYRHSVKLGNDSKMKVMGKGSVRLDVNGRLHILTDVYYVPELKSNLVSIGQLQKKGTSILIRDGVCRVYHPVKGLILQSLMSTNRMFVLMSKLPSNTPTCYNASIEDNTRLWHSRYGHLANIGLQKLKDENLVFGLPELKFTKEQCQLFV